MLRILGGRRGRLAGGLIAGGLASVLLVAPAAAAEEAKKTGWFEEAELSLVSTSGNSRSETFSLRNTLTRVWQEAELKITTGGLRASTTDVSRSAVGTSPADARLVESSTTAVTAERYDFEARYERRLSETWFWYTSAGWQRDEPAGIANRASVAAGAGNRWFETEGARWRTDYALTWTDQQDVFEPPGQGGGFAGLRLSSDYWRRLTSTTDYANLTTVDRNLDRGRDTRAHMVNSLSVRASARVALKVSHEVQFDNAPSLIAVPISSPEGTPLGEDLLIEAMDLDTTLSLALVVAF